MHKISSAFLRALSASAPREVTVQVQYMCAPTGPEIKSGEPGRMEKFREHLPAFRAALKELGDMAARDDNPERLFKLRQELETQFWHDVFGPYLLRRQDLTVQLADSVPFDVLMMADEFWREHAPEHPKNLTNKDKAQAARLVLERLTGSAERPLQLDFLKTAIAGHDPEEAIDHATSLPRTRAFLKRWLGYDGAVILSAIIADMPGSGKQGGQMRTASHFDLSGGRN
jgi:hypothetical protein